MREQLLPEQLRVAIVTESFLPTVNGVTTSVRQILHHLRRGGHEATVLCPGPAPVSYEGYPVRTVRAVQYRQFPVGLPSREVSHLMRAFRPDVVHVASPFALGATALAVARRAGLPTVAVYQTDVARYARHYGIGLMTATAWQVIRHVHGLADLTLAPSTGAAADLTGHGVDRVAIWGRGVDTRLFTPARRDTPAVRALRTRLCPNGEVLVGYVGRLAPEKRVERLAVLRGLPGVHLVVVGDGPTRAQTEQALAGVPVTFLGRLDGEELADAYACLDVFVHTGTHETFGQTVQEAMAAGVPVLVPDAGGPRDLVDHGVQGLRYPAEEDSALRAGLVRLLGSASERARMGEAGRRAALPRSWNALGEELLDHYRAVITARRRVAA